jgi:hypothetical protein
LNTIKIIFRLSETFYGSTKRAVVENVEATHRLQFIRALPLRIHLRVGFNLLGRDVDGVDPMAGVEFAGHATSITSALLFSCAAASRAKFGRRMSL